MLHGIVHTAVTCRLTVTEESLVTIHIEAVSKPISAESSASGVQHVNHAGAECPAAAVVPASSASFDPYTWLAASGLLVASQEAIPAEEFAAVTQSAGTGSSATTATAMAAALPSLDEQHAALPDGPPGSSWVCDLCESRCTRKADLLVHLRGKRHTAALTALLAADPEAAAPGLSFCMPALSAAPSLATSVASPSAATSAQDTSGSVAAAASAGAVTAYDASWQPPAGTQHACRICRFASNSDDTLQHFKSKGHEKACNALISKGVTVCKPCGLVCPDLGNLKGIHWPGSRHQTRIALLSSSSKKQATPARPAPPAAHEGATAAPPPPPSPRPAKQVPEPDGTTAADHAASASTATPAAERNTVSLATLLEIVTCPVTKGIMGDPCIAGDGITYERSAVESHLAARNTSPVLGIELAHNHVTPNNAVRELTAWLVSVGVIEL